MPLVDMMKEQEPVVATHNLREKIAEAIFNHAGRGYGQPWQMAKHNDQWLALGSWDAAGEVMKVLPIDIKVKV